MPRLRALTSVLSKQASSYQVLSKQKQFKNLWYDKVKTQIQDEKVKAYLMVFDDAFPGMNHVIDFVRENAQEPISLIKKQTKVYKAYSYLLVKM